MIYFHPSCPWWVVLLGCLLTLAPSTRAADWIWIEGESANRSDMRPHPWYGDVDKAKLSGGEFQHHFAVEGPPTAAYEFSVEEAGTYDFWVRANPVQTRLAYRVDEKDWREIPFDGDLIGQTNIAKDDKPDLRFLAWVKVGKLPFKVGTHKIEFRFDSENNFHGSIDCFVLSKGPFKPEGILKPDEIEKSLQDAARQNEGWVLFRPDADPFDAAALDLRSLNEDKAGQGGFIQARDGSFVHGDTGEAVRFWGVNNVGSKNRVGLIAEGRMLAKRGVNLVRIHGGVFDERTGDWQAPRLDRIREIVSAMKPAGIYSHLSIYFPLWMTPAADLDWLPGYDDRQHPFATLMFNQEFQKRYRSWWTRVLTTPDPATGRKLIDEPALMGIEIQNEDSFFFWTFDAKNIPDPQLRMIETQFATWLADEYGSTQKAIARWDEGELPRDVPEQGRIALVPLWNLINRQSERDKDTVAFLLDKQKSFYEETTKFLRGLGFQGVITASNWHTASEAILGPLEKLSYTPGDFIDHHGYFGCLNEGENASWSIRDGHSFINRSALRFEPNSVAADAVSGGKDFAHPITMPTYNGMPSMLSETGWTRPNRYRGEAPLFLSVYASVQDSDAIIHFAQDGANWSVKPNFFMQPWTLMSPTMLGQFPATALAYRKGYINPGKPVASVDLNIDSLTELRGSPIAPGASLDELRAADVPEQADVPERDTAGIDPLVYFTGPTEVNFTDGPARRRVADLTDLINRDRQTVTNNTGEVRLDYQRGVLYVNSPRAQAVSGHLSELGTVMLDQIRVRSKMEIGHLALVSLDGKPIESSDDMLLQVMSEEKTNGFATTPMGGNQFRIDDIGGEPWLMKEISGLIGLRRDDADQLKVTPLDFNGYPIAADPPLNAKAFELQPGVIYYRISR